MPSGCAQSHIVDEFAAVLSDRADVGVEVFDGFEMGALPERTAPLTSIRCPPGALSEAL
jgi:hypothetical protein